MAVSDPRKFVALIGERFVRQDKGGFAFVETVGEASAYESREAAEFAAWHATGDSNLKGVRIVGVR